MESPLKIGLVIKQEPPSNSLVEEESPASFVVSTSEKKKGNGSHYEILDYTLPQGLLSKVLKIVLRDGRGSRQIYEEEESPHSRVILPLWLLGEGEVEIYLDGKLVQREVFK